MNRKMYWGVALLILLIGTAAVFMLTRTTETEPVTVYNPLTEADKKQVEQNIQDAIDKEKQNLPPIAEEDRQQVDDPITEVSDETNEQVSKGSDLSKYDGKPLDEDFYRDNFSREELESMLKLDQRDIKHLKTVNIPALEKTRKSQLKLIQSIPGPVPHLEKGLARTEGLIRLMTNQLEFYEKSIPIISNVLNEGVE